MDRVTCISIDEFLKAFTDELDEGHKFCFILGAGASVESGIPDGCSLGYRWMSYLMGDDRDGEINYTNRTLSRQQAEALREHNKTCFNFSEIEAAWENAKREGVEKLPSQYYFDLYQLRFDSKEAGHYYIEKEMAEKEPSLGYSVLARVLAQTSTIGKSDLVITTNFDNLVEDALFLYTGKKPVVINHEALTRYIQINTQQRPIIAKIHRGLFFDPQNTPEETEQLFGDWKYILADLFKTYTPIVIGYGGGDTSLMDVLKDPNTTMNGGLYWCCRDANRLTPDVINLLNMKKGKVVQINGFDSFMLSIGIKMFKEGMNAQNTAEYLTEKSIGRIEHYYNAIRKLTASSMCAEKNAGPEQLIAWDWWDRGCRQFEQKHYLEAYISISEAIKQNPENYVFYGLRGLCRFEEYAYIEAHGEIITDEDKFTVYDVVIQDYETIIELKPDFFNSHKELADGYANVFYNQGHLYKLCDEYPKALESFKNALLLNAGHRNALVEERQIRIALGELPETV